MNFGWNLGSAGIESELILEELFVECVLSDYKLRVDLLSAMSELSLSPKAFLGTASLRAVERAGLGPVKVFMTLWLLVRMALMLRMRKPIEDAFSMRAGVCCLALCSTS